MTAKNPPAEKATVETVVAKAKEEKLVTVPAQDGPQEPLTGEKVAEETSEVKLEVIEGGKKSLKERLAFAKKKVQNHHKVVAAVTSAVITVGIIALAKQLKKQAEVVEEQLEPVEPELTDEQAESIKQDLEAAEIGG